MVKISREGRLYRQARLARQWMVAHRKGLRYTHPTASIHRTAMVSRDLVTDAYAYVGPNCTISASTHLGAYCLLAGSVAILGGDHPIDEVGTPMQFGGRPPRSRTIVGRDAWLGHGAIVTRGVTIGEGSVVGAGSVVTRDVPEYEIWAGVPARKIRDRFSPEERARHRAALDQWVGTPRFASPLEEV